MGRPTEAPLAFRRFPEFALKPTMDAAGFHRIGGHCFRFVVIALRALKGAIFKVCRTGDNNDGYHPRRASGTTRTLNRKQFRFAIGLLYWLTFSRGRNLILIQLCDGNQRVQQLDFTAGASSDIAFEDGLFWVERRLDLINTLWA
jgi:hypothetical protein